MSGQDNDTLQEGKIQISVWVNRTVQPQQYCPYQVGMSGKMIVPEEEADEAYSDLFKLIDQRIDDELVEIGYVKK